MPRAPQRTAPSRRRRARGRAQPLCKRARSRARCQRIATAVCTKPHRWQHSRGKSILQATSGAAEARSARIRGVARVALISCIPVRFTLPRHDATALGIDCNLALVVNHHMRRTFSVRRTATRPPARDTLTLQCGASRPRGQTENSGQSYAIANCAQSPGARSRLTQPPRAAGASMRRAQSAHTSNAHSAPSDPTP